MSTEQVKTERRARTALLRGKPALKIVPRLPDACANLKAPTGESVECGSCQGRVSLKLFECQVHGTCTIGKKVDGRACCKGCPDYVTAGAA